MPVSGLSLNGYSFFADFLSREAWAHRRLCFALSVHTDDENEIHESRDEGEQNDAP